MISINPLQAQVPLISVIVPVYKAEAFLARCVESILLQTERAFELLLIDDGSPDGSPELCDNYAALDPRVRVVHKPNGGVSSARNAGLDQARGEFIVFIDSDDYVSRDYLAQMVQSIKEAENPGKTLIVTDYQPFSPQGDEKRSFPQPFSVDLTKTPISAQAFRNLIFGFRLFPPYCKLYRRDIIESEHIRFDTSFRTAEDFDFNMRYVAHVDYIRYIPAPTYHYRVDYKKYRPSNHGVLGDSEIKSAHIMANGIVKLAKRTGVYEEVLPDISRWAAQKHYFNRLPMLFAPSNEVGKAERRVLFKRLTADPVYLNAYKQGIKLMPKSTTRKIGCYADTFAAWYAFYLMLDKRRKKSEQSRTKT